MPLTGSGKILKTALRAEYGPQKGISSISGMPCRTLHSRLSAGAHRNALFCDKGRPLINGASQLMSNVQASVWVPDYIADSPDSAQQR